jgi:rod shape determining protein RodA
MLVCDRKLHIAALKFAKATTYWTQNTLWFPNNLKQVNRQFQALAIVFLPFYSFYHLKILVALLIYSIFLIVLYREDFPLGIFGFITILLFVLTLVLQPQYVMWGALLVICYTLLRSADRNIIISSFFLAIISGLFYRSTVFQNLF